MNDHRWAMAFTFDLDDDQAAAIADGERWEPAGDGKLSGPGCETCMQPYANCKDLPCPGRIWGDDDDAKNQALSKLPRQARRDRRKAERKDRRVTNGRMIVELPAGPGALDRAMASAISRGRPLSPAELLQREGGALVPGLAYDPEILVARPQSPKPKFAAPTLAPKHQEAARP